MITTVTTTTTTTIVTGTQIFIGGLVAVATLVVLLGLREIFGTDARKDPIRATFSSISGIVSIPLLFAFVAILVYKVIEVI